MVRLDRRTLLKTGAGAALLGPAAARADAPPPPKGTADACIFLWLGGGAAQIDTFDPKRRSKERKVPGSYYDAIPTAVPGLQVCEHLPLTAAMMERIVLVRTLTHDFDDEHAAATNFVHTGRKPSGTVVYPSIGSVVAHQLGPKTEEVPAYVVMGYPNVARDPGFLGPKYGYVYLTQLETGPNGLVRAPDVDAARQRRREGLLGVVKRETLRRDGSDEQVRGQTEVSELGFRMAGPRFLSVFDLKKERPSLRAAYGSEFGQRCLLARRLVQAGVRFVEVSYNLNFRNGTGWDTHNEGQINQHLLIRDLDMALATLIADLEKHRMLDRTVIAIGTEFGRPPEFDAGGGRGHQSAVFSGLLAGGGMRTGRAIGQSDDLAKSIVERPVTIPDYHATIYAALGINPSVNLYAGSRPVPVTDYGRPLRELFG